MKPYVLSIRIPGKYLVQNLKGQRSCIIRIWYPGIYYWVPLTAHQHIIWLNHRFVHKTFDTLHITVAFLFQYNVLSNNA